MISPSTVNSMATNATLPALSFTSRFIARIRNFNVWLDHAPLLHDPVLVARTPPPALTPLPGPWGFLTSGYIVGLIIMVFPSLSPPHLSSHIPGRPHASHTEHRRSTSSQSASLPPPSIAPQVVLPRRISCHIPSRFLLLLRPSRPPSPLPLLLIKITLALVHNSFSDRTQIPSRFPLLSHPRFMGRTA